MDSIASRLEICIREVLVPAVSAWGIVPDDARIATLVAYGVEMLSWNERVNLTRITAPRDIVVRHFLDSLACVTAFDHPPESLADIGTGAGFPGIPLKIFWPDMRLMLSDSVGKKTAFVSHVVDTLALNDVTVVTARAEALGRDARYRERFEAVAARAVAALDVLCEYTLPLCAVGGRLVAPKGVDGAREAEAAGRAIGKLGGKLSGVLPVTLPGIEPRTLVVVDKLRPTPPDLPRAPGLPGKRPL